MSAESTRSASRRRGSRRRVWRVSRCVVLAAAVSALVPAALASGEIDDGHALLRACKGFLNLDPGNAPAKAVEESSSGAYCAGFINGILDMNALYQGTLLAPERGLFCVGKESLTTEQTVQAIVKYLEAHPEELHLPKRLPAVLGLAEAFPCRGDVGARAALRPPPGVSGRWRLLNSDAIRMLREQDQSIRVSGTIILPNGVVDETSYDLLRQKDGTYEGRVVARWTCGYNPFDRDPSSPPLIRECPFEERIVLTSVAPDRIEGRILHRGAPSPDSQEFVSFCRTCGVDVEQVWRPFTWIRLDGTP